MTRWRVETFFQKITLIVLFLVTLMFVLILTNVYVDIDGLITRKPNNNTTAKHVKEKIVRNVASPNYVDNGSRTKRSLEPQKLNIKIGKNKKMKEILTNRLVSLLEELDVEANNKETTEPIEITQTTPKNDLKVVYNNLDELRHLSLHNVLLKGIIGHMDMSEVYRKIIELFDTYTPYYEITEPSTKLHRQEEKSQEPENEEKYDNKILKELLTCKSLRNQVDHHEKNKNKTKQDQHLSIKTLIDITNPKDMTRNVSANNKVNDNIKGIINLLYNGKRVKISQDSDDPPAPVKKTTTTTQKITTLRTHKVTNKQSMESAENKNKILNQMLYDYYKRNIAMNTYGLPMLSDMMPEQAGSADSEQKRSKRNIIFKNGMKTKGIRDIKNKKLGITDKVMLQNKRLDKNIKSKKKHDDDLYVEIETHFDDKGQLGAKKKKLIQKLIEKIEKAINNNNNSAENKPKNKQKIKKVAQIRRRSQNPLNLDFRVNKTNILPLKVITPVETIAQRQINPMNNLISTLVRTPNEETNETWKKKYRETNHIITEKENHFNEQTDVNGMIPQRLQEPLVPQEKGVYDVDMGDFKFVIKDLEGTGFTIGFSQYVGENNGDQMKMFTNVEDLLQNYHEQYDTDDPREVMDTDGNTSNPILEHNMYKRSIDNKKSTKQKNNNDYHYNTYKVLFKRKHTLPYKTYKDIYDKSDSGNINYNEKILNNIIVDRVMKPSEIFSLADLINTRKKRYINNKKVTKIRPRNNLTVNKYLNTRTFPRVIYNKIARVKRGAISKIRIIAKDFVNETNESADDIVLYSDEKVFADRALVKDIQIPTENEESPYNLMPVQYYNSPYNPEHNLLRNFFDSVRTTHNRMMSRYPHVFIDDAPKPVEDEKDKSIDQITEQDDAPEQTEEENIQREDFLNLVKNIPNSGQNSNYKLTVKILPSNVTDDASGFREVHTSINKTYNKDGRAYVSLLNISEISKIENLLNSTDCHNISHNKNNSSIKIFHGGIANEFQTEHGKKIKELLLKKRDKINIQLKKLENEKHKIEKIMQISTTTVKPYTTSDTFSLLNISKDMLLSLILNAIKSNKTEETSVTTMTSTMTTTMTPVNTSKTQEIHDHEILNKIDRNTKVLEEILRTISTRNYDYVNYLMSNEINSDIKSKQINDSKTNPTVSKEIVTENKHDDVKKPIATVIYKGTVYSAGVTPHGDINLNLITTIEPKTRKDGQTKTDTKPKFNIYAPVRNVPFFSFSSH